MKALILDGSLKKDTEIDPLYSSIIDEIEEMGFEVESIILRDVDVAPCQGRFDCWVKTPGECRTSDYGRDVAEKMVQSDLIIHFTPITFGGYSSEIKKVIDRFLPTISPFFTKRNGETHHKHRYQKRASIIVIGFLEKSDNNQQKVFKDLVFRNSLNMGAPIHECIIYIKGQKIDGIRKELHTILEKVEVNA
jgi:multimeric flavodoxin WrbA